MCGLIGISILYFKKILDNGRDPKTQMNFNEIIEVKEKDENISKPDCSSEVRYCTSDFDCAYLCDVPKSYNVKLSCDGKTNMCATAPIVMDSKCDAQKGFFDTYVQNEYSSLWKCLNTRPYLFDDQQKKLSHVCGNVGMATYNFEKNQDLTCTCPQNYVNAINIHKPHVPLCIKKTSLKLLSSFIEV